MPRDLPRTRDLARSFFSHGLKSVACEGFPTCWEDPGNICQMKECACVSPFESRTSLWRGSRMRAKRANTSSLTGKYSAVWQYPTIYLHVLLRPTCLHSVCSLFETESWPSSLHNTDILGHCFRAALSPSAAGISLRSSPPTWIVFLGNSFVSVDLVSVSGDPASSFVWFRARLVKFNCASLCSVHYQLGCSAKRCLVDDRTAAKGDKRCAWV